MNRRRALYIFLTLLALILVGTVVVLSSITYYLSIDPSAYLSELEIPFNGNETRWNATEHGQVERIPRIIHQTWKTEELPQKWKGISQACRDMMPDYEYMLWTDAKSREFIAEHYPWFLETFDSYTYNIQRADAIRYFILYHYGGIYMDLDIGCLRPMDQLLAYPVILAKTIPVGVSNDLIFSERGHPFMEQTIHNLVTFDNNLILNYPTVMFSTGPMFLSAQYGVYSSHHPNSYLEEIRILPKALYGKNAKDGEAPHSFFSHFYGSSWHAGDAGFIAFLNTWGKPLMVVGLIVFIYGVIRLSGGRQRSYRMRGYEILLPRISQQSGRWQLHLGGWSAPPSQQHSPLTPSSPVDSDIPVLHLPLDVPSSPSISEASTSDLYAGRTQSPIVQAFNRIRNRVVSIAGVPEDAPRTPVRSSSRRRHHSRGVLFFLPAVFTRSPDIELGTTPSAPPLPSMPRTSNLPPEKSHFQIYDDDDDLSRPGTSYRSRDDIASNRSSIDSQRTRVDDPRGRSSHSRRSSRSRSSSRPHLF